MKHLSQFLVLIAAITIVSCQTKESKSTTISEAQRIHEAVITIDTHDDINVGNFTDSINYTQKTNSQVNLPNMKAGGLDVSWFIVYTGQDSLTKSGFEKAAATAEAAAAETK